MIENYDILILGGGEVPEGLEAYSDYGTKATLKLGGRLMIEYVVDALAAAPGAGRILVVGHEEPLKRVLGDRVWRVEPAADTMLANLRRGVDVFAGSQWLLAASCDIPLIAPGMIGRFVETCGGMSGDIFAALLAREIFAEKFPTTKRTYGRLKEGSFTTGNVFLLKPSALRDNWGHIDDVIAARKSPLKLVRLIGFMNIIRFVFKQLSLARAEKTVQNILGVEGHCAPCIDPEIGIDVDKVVDYELVKSILEK